MPGGNFCSVIIILFAKAIAVFRSDDTEGNLLRSRDLGVVGMALAWLVVGDKYSLILYPILGIFPKSSTLSR